jgi:hypothetical protein
VIAKPYAMLFECFDISQDSCSSCGIKTSNTYYERAIWRHDLKFSIGLLLFQIIPKVLHRQSHFVCRMLSAEIPLKAMSCVL